MVPRCSLAGGRADTRTLCIVHTHSYILYWILISYSLTTRVLPFSVACVCRCCRNAVVPEYYIFCMQPMRGRGTNSGGSEIFRTRPHRRWGPPNLLYNGYRVSFSGVEGPGRGGDHPSPSNAEVKERVELYLYSPSGPSGIVLRSKFRISGNK